MKAFRFLWNLITQASRLIISCVDVKLKSVLVEYNVVAVLQMYIGIKDIQEHLLVLDGKMDTLKHDMQHGFDMLSGSPIRIHADFEGHAGSLIIQHAHEIKNLDIHCAPLSINHYVTDATTQFTQCVHSN